MKEKKTHSSNDPFWYLCFLKKETVSPDEMSDGWGDRADGIKHCWCMHSTRDGVCALYSVRLQRGAKLHNRPFRWDISSGDTGTNFPFNTKCTNINICSYRYFQTCLAILFFLAGGGGGDHECLHTTSYSPSTPTPPPSIWTCLFTHQGPVTHK